MDIVPILQLPILVRPHWKKIAEPGLSPCAAQAGAMTASVVRRGIQFAQFLNDCRESFRAGGVLLRACPLLACLNERIREIAPASALALMTPDIS